MCQENNFELLLDTTPQEGNQTYSVNSETQQVEAGVHGDHGYHPNGGQTFANSVKA